MTFTRENGSTARLCCLLVGWFGAFLVDKHHILFGVILLVAAVVGVIYTVMHPDKVEKEEDEDEEIRSQYSMTIRQLIDLLEEEEDDTLVVIDVTGNPITAVTSTYDEDFNKVLRLLGFPESREYLRSARKQKQGDTNEVHTTPVEHN